MELRLRIKERTGEDWHDLESPALPQGFLREAGQYEIKAVVPRPQADLALRISDGVLAPSTIKISEHETEVRWNWDIDHYAGEIELALSAENTEPFHTRLDVSPHPDKLGRQLHAELLSELQELAEGLAFGLTAGQAPVSSNPALSPLVSCYALFRTYAPLLVSSFSRIAERPHRRLRGFREEVAIHKVRRCDARTVVRASRSVAAHAVLRIRGQAADPCARFDVPRMEHTFDTPLNRYIRHLLGCLTTAAQNLASSLEAYRCDSDEVKQRVGAWAAHLRDILAAISRMEREAFLEDVAPSASDPSALIAISRHPHYARFAKICRLILHPSVLLGAIDEARMTMRPTYEIYEYWCFLKLGTMLREQFPDFAWHSSCGPMAAGLLLSIPDESTLSGSQGDKELTLTFQKNYRHKPSCAPEPFSISTPFRPDFVLSLRQGGCSRLLIFDAKYRSSPFSIKEALRDMHVYRDAIRVSSARSAVDAAFILVPAFDSGMARFFESAYREEYGFGGFRLTPGGDHDEPLINLLKTVVERHASPKQPDWSMA